MTFIPLFSSIRSFLSHAVRSRCQCSRRPVLRALYKDTTKWWKNKALRGKQACAQGCSFPSLPAAMSSPGRKPSQSTPIRHQHSHQTPIGICYTYSRCYSWSGFFGEKNIICPFQRHDYTAFRHRPTFSQKILYFYYLSRKMLIFIVQCDIFLLRDVFG